ncbi:Tetratricopeptide repeat (TPR)-like superfamily protein [Euphorbia peplus]|nr:Tetratricopeptide repeat (TPR)-like superfamily protein [Euphorbia peplus]
MNVPKFQSPSKYFLTATKSQLKHNVITLSLTKHLHALQSSPLSRKVFDEMPDRSVIRYNKLMSTYLNTRQYPVVLKVFSEMLQLGIDFPDNYSYPIVIKACSELKLLHLGRMVHGCIMVSMFGLDTNTYVQNSLLSMYMNCGEEEVAIRVFKVMSKKSVVSWNAMISGYFRNGNAKKALSVFDRMVDFGVEIDCATLLSVFSVCGYLGELERGRKVHALMERNGLDKKIAVRNALVDMYVKCGSMVEARSVFDGMSERDVISWTSMINGYALSRDSRSSLALCRMMQKDGIRPNSVTIASILSVCDNSRDGSCFHGWTIRQNLESNVDIETSLIDMYAKCNRINLSFEILKRTSIKRTVPWNAMLSGCIHNGLAAEAIGLFKQMQSKGVEWDDVTLKSLLPAYTILVDLQSAKNMHCYLMKSGFLSWIEVATSLINTYSKCGSLDSSHQIFNDIPVAGKDIYVWSVIISAYGMHGHGETAVSLFTQMVQSGVNPNGVTFTSVLQACSHAGLVDEGLDLFQLVVRDLEMRPNDDHYTCIVDLLGRGGRLDEAYELVKAMPFLPSYAVWGALLGACVIHGNVEVGEVAAQRLFELEPENTGNYVLLTKLYAAVGRWEDAENVRREMNNIGLKKTCALSSIDAVNI